MIYKTCLIIDNEDQTEEISKLVRDARNRGISLDCHQFNVGNTAYSEILTNGLIDIAKVFIEFKKRFHNLHFDLVAFDWDLEDDNITGIELIQQFTLNKIIKFSPKIVYSGVLDDVLKKIVEENLGIAKIEDEEKPYLNHAGLTKIKFLIKNRVLDYLDRGNRDSMILKFLKEDIQSTELIISQTLRKHPELKFNNNFVNTKFNGSTFEDLAKELESNDSINNEFKKEIIEQVISYLTEKI